MKLHGKRQGLSFYVEWNQGSWFSFIWRSRIKFGSMNILDMLPEIPQRTIFSPASSEILKWLRSTIVPYSSREYPQQRLRRWGLNRPVRTLGGHFGRRGSTAVESLPQGRAPFLVFHDIVVILELNIWPAYQPPNESSYSRASKGPIPTITQHVINIWVGAVQIRFHIQTPSHGGSR